MFNRRVTVEEPTLIDEKIIEDMKDGDFAVIVKDCSSYHGIEGSWELGDIVYRCMGIGGSMVTNLRTLTWNFPLANLLFKIRILPKGTKITIEV